MTKRLIQVVQHLEPGGIETMALDLKAFSPADTEVRIVSLEGTADQALSHWPRLAAHHTALTFMSKAPGVRLDLILQLAALFRTYRPDAIHTHHIGPLLYGGIAARLAGVRTVIHTEHDAWHLEHRRRRMVARLALALVRPHVVADARFVFEAFQRATGYRNARVILNGIDTDRFSPGDKQSARQTLGLRQERTVIGCAARLTPVKGHAFLLRALTMTDPHVDLALAGDGPCASELQRLAHELGIASRVHFLGRIDDMPRFYHALDAFVLPSLAEGLPLSPLEAQACGVPAVVTDVGGAAEAICPRTGIVVKPADPNALAGGIADVLDRSKRGSPRPFVLASADVTNMVRSYRSLLSLT